MKESKEVNIVQKLDEHVQYILATIVALEKLLPPAEQNRLKKKLDDAGNDNSISAETIFGLSAIAGFFIAIEVEAQRKKVARKFASGN